MMVIASSAAPNQSHCCWASGSSSFISPLVQSNTRSKDSGSRAIRSLPLSKRIKESLCRRALFPIARAPMVGSSGVHDRLERRGREKEPIDFPAIHSREPDGAGPRVADAEGGSRAAIGRGPGSYRVGSLRSVAPAWISFSFRALFQRQFTDKLHDAIVDDIRFNAEP